MLWKNLHIPSKRTSIIVTSYLIQWSLALPMLSEQDWRTFSNILCTYKKRMSIASSTNWINRILYGLKRSFHNQISAYCKTLVLFYFVCWHFVVLPGIFEFPCRNCRNFLSFFICGAFHLWPFIVSLCHFSFVGWSTNFEHDFRFWTTWWWR